MTSHKDREDAPITDPAGTDLDRVLKAADDELLRHIHAYGRPNAALLSIMSAGEQEETSHRPPDPQPASTRTTAADNAIALIESRLLARDLGVKAATARDRATECRTLLRRTPASHEEAESAIRLGSLPGLGRFLTGPGEPLYRSFNDLKCSEARAMTESQDCQAALAHAKAMAEERRNRHRGGDRPWLLRLLIPLAILAEGVTVFIFMEALVQSLLLGGVLAALAALIGAGMACVLANRRLNRLPVPVAARILEGLFVAVLTALSVQVDGAGLSAAVGAALTALITALSLLGIEEVLVETHTFGVFVSRRRAAYWRWRAVRVAAPLGRRRAQARAAAVTLRQHFLGFLLREGLGPDDAQLLAAALMRALGEENRADYTGAYRSASCRGLLADLATELHESLRLARSIPCAPAAWRQLLELICKTADHLARTAETLPPRPAPELSIAKLNDIGLSLAGLISEIDRFVADEVDVSGLDLSRAVLPDVDLLKGVIWTLETTWPPGLAETVRAQSTMIGDGVYQVIGGAERDPDLARV